MADEKKMGPFDVVKNINGHGERLDMDGVSYDPFVINRVFSNTPDTVLFANELNQHWRMSKQMQYDFYRFGVTKHPRRYGKWVKRETGDDALLELIKETYGYSRAKAIEALPLLRDHVEVLEKHLNKGGRK